MTDQERQQREEYRRQAVYQLEELRWQRTTAARQQHRPQQQRGGNGKGIIFVVIVIIYAVLLFIATTGSTGSRYKSYSSGNYTGYRRGTNTPVFSTSRPAATPKSNTGSGYGSGSGKSSSTGKRKVYDSDSVSGYYHPEDYYYDHWDDFTDYEEAEEYYYDHGGF